MNDRAISLKKVALANTTLLGAVSLMSCMSFAEPLYVLLYVILFAIAVFIDATGRKHPPRLLMNVASVGVLASSVMRMRFDTFIVVFTEALLLMTAVKALEEKQARDYFQIAALSVFTVISAAVDALEGSFLYYCVIISVCAGFELMLGTWLSREPDAVISGREAFQFAKKALLIWAMMLPLCLSLFFIAPRARLTLGALPARGAEGRVGFTDRLTLGSVKAIKEDNSLAFRVVMPLVAPKYLYWRGLVLDAFDGHTWSYWQRGRGGEILFDPENDTVKQEVFMESVSYMSVIFALDVPVMANAQGVVPAGDGVFLNGNFRERVRSYTVISSLSDRLRPANANFQRSRYTRLPENFSPSLEKLAREITLGLSDDEKPGAVMNYLLSQEYSYSLTDLPVSSNPLEEFVFSAKRGNCEYFAAAMAVLLRMGGIPSRLVTGYHGGVYNDSGGYYMVNQSSAHVWVEAWNEREGAWIRYNPTPSSGEAGGESGAAANLGQFGMYIDYINYQLSKIFLEYGGETQLQAIETLRALLSRPTDAMAAAVDGLSEMGRKYYGALAVIALIAAAVFGAKHRKRFGLRGKISREEAVRERFLAAMRRRGFEKRASDGLEEFVQSLMPSGPGEIYEPAARFVLSFEEIYFKNARMTEEEEQNLRALVAMIENPSR